MREKIASGKKVGGKRKKELKEAITAKLTARAEFVPSVIDCLWDAEKGRLLVGSASAKAVQPVLELFKTTFGMGVTPITPAGDMPKLFAAILRGEGTLYPMGSASLAASEQAEEKAAVAVQNSLNAVAQALEKGMAIQKLHMVVTSGADPDMKLQDAEKTWSLIKDLAGQGTVLRTSGFNVKVNLGTGYHDSLNTTVEQEDRVALRDLQEQIEGEAHFVFSDQIVRGDMFYANPSLKNAKLRVPQLVQVDISLEDENAI